MTMINSDERLNQVGMKKNKANDYFSRKKNKDDLRPENLLTTGNRPDLNLAKEMQDFYRTNIGKKEIAELDPNRLPEVFENKDIEYKRRLNGYANLSLSFCQFFYKNFLARNILITPFFNISMFGPRWKKLIVFTKLMEVQPILPKYLHLIKSTKPIFRLNLGLLKEIT